MSSDSSGLPLREILSDIGSFSQVGSRPLRAYQLECARAVVQAVLHGEGKVFTVMLARQMGKNETSAQLEAYLMALYARQGGCVVKAAPSFKPQLINSILRLKATLQSNPLTRKRWKSAFGYMLQLGNCTTMFLSAERHANVMGATASLLLEIDEAQDVDPDKYDREFRPMASSTNATTVLYGTAWSEDSILERQRQINLAHQRRTGERLHFEYDWRVLASILPAYRSFVEAEMERLGEQHPSIQTQYLLRCMIDAGRLFSAEQRAALAGQHARQRSPVDGCVYVAGIDVAGEDEQAEDAQARLLSPKRDSTVVTIAEVMRDANGSAVARVVEHVWWTGRNQVWQFENLVQLWEHWIFASVCVDASGIGAGLAAFLEDRFPERVEKVIFTAPSKSQLAYRMLAMTNTRRVSVYKEDQFPMAGLPEGPAVPFDGGRPSVAGVGWDTDAACSPEAREFWNEIRACRYWMRAAEQMGWGVPESEGHDDFVVSLALCCRAAEDLIPPAAGVLIRSKPDHEQQEW
jgi:hypothetical protein